MRKRLLLSASSKPSVSILKFNCREGTNNESRSCTSVSAGKDCPARSRKHSAVLGSIPRTPGFYFHVRAYCLESTLGCNPNCPRRFPDHFVRHHQTKARIPFHRLSSS